MNPPAPSPELQAQLARLKAWLPFRIVWGFDGPEGPQTFASLDKRRMNKEARKGTVVFLASRG